MKQGAGRLIRDEIDQALGPVELVAQSVVLTGGAAQLRGAVDLARDRFRLPTRLGQPRGIVEIAARCPCGCPRTCAVNGCSATPAPTRSGPSRGRSRW